MPMTVAASNPAWTITDYLEVRDGHLAISGADALELVREFDSPLFVFSGPRIRSNIDRLKSAAASVAHPIRFFYASKANSNLAVLKLVHDSGIDIEVNSGGELFKALRVASILPKDKVKSSTTSTMVRRTCSGFNLSGTGGIFICFELAVICACTALFTSGVTAM